MTGEILLPPNYRSIEGPLIFLAGPIQGAPKWHNKAIKIIQDIDSYINIASPSKKVDRIYLKQNQEKFKHSANQEEWEQIDWETFYLNRAAQKGAIMFWFPNEEAHYCERAYAQTSRFELGEWKTEHKQGRGNIVIGFEKGFSGEHYIKYRLSKDNLNIPILSSLKETCRVSINKAKATS